MGELFKHYIFCQPKSGNSRFLSGVLLHPTRPEALTALDYTPSILVTTLSLKSRHRGFFYEGIRKILPIHHHRLTKSLLANAKLAVVSAYRADT